MEEEDDRELQVILLAQLLGQQNEMVVVDPDRVPLHMHMHMHRSNA